MIKSYTDIEQSKKLAEILPLESTDMYYFRQIDNDYFPLDVESICPIPLFKDGKQDFTYDVPCWSLAVLLKTLNFPSLTQNKEDEWEVCVFDHDNDDYIKKTASNPVDACVAMIEKLHELNLL